MRDGWIRDDRGTEYEIVRLTKSETAKISDYRLGGGAEGSIFKVRDNTGQFWIFKSVRDYNKHMARLKEVRAIYDYNHSFFDDIEFDFGISYTWPFSFVNSGYVLCGKPLDGGYIMRLQDLKTTVTCEKMSDDEMESWSYSEICNISIRLCRAVGAFHDKGYSYKDVSKDNICLNPDYKKNDKKSIIVIDPDNIGGDKDPTQIKGTPGYRPPELATGKVAPNINSDLYAVAIMLFQIWMKADPFVGSAQNADGTPVIDWDSYRDKRPVFVFDPKDKSNTLLGDINSLTYYYWMASPKSLRECFVRAFGDGTRNASMRPTMKDWVSVLTDVKYNGFKYCPHCGKLMAKSGAHCAACSEDNNNSDSSTAILMHVNGLGFEKTKTWKIVEPSYVSGAMIDSALSRYEKALSFSYVDNNGKMEMFVKNNLDVPINVVLIYNKDKEKPTLLPGKKASVKLVLKLELPDGIDVNFDIASEK